MCMYVDSGRCTDLHLPVCKRIAGNERNRCETLKKNEDSAFLFGSAAPTVQFTTQSQSFQQMNDNDARAVMGLAPVK